ncbi:MAG: DUF4340 domain-containing protein [Limisphaerales bacterium]|jgi:hypothetical protein|nr:DUF4340 domain-containing protein [Verrucomicrobiota bacterium]
MNLKALIGLIVAAAVAIAITASLMKKDSASWQTAEVGGLLFEDLPVNDVEQIHITQGSENLTLNKQNDIWVVKERYNYPASFQDISQLVIRLSETKPLRVIEAGQSQLGRLSLLPPQEDQGGGTLLEMKGAKDKLLLSLLLGKPYVRQSEAQKNPMMGMYGDMPEGRYVLLGNTPPVYLIDEPFESVEPNPTAWLNKDFFKVERLSSVSVQFMGESAPDWEFSRETISSDFELKGALPTENADASKTRSLSSVFSYASFNDVLPLSTDPDITRLNLPTIVVIKTFDGFTYTIHIGKLTADESERYLSVKVDAQLQSERIVPADEKEEDKARLDAEFQRELERLQKKLVQEKKCEEWIYLVSTWSVENLLKNRVDWMSAEEPGAEEPQEASIPELLASPEDFYQEEDYLHEDDYEYEEPAELEPEYEEPGELDPYQPIEGEEIIILEDELVPPDDYYEEDNLEPLGQGE